MTADTIIVPIGDLAFWNSWGGIAVLIVAVIAATAITVILWEPYSVPGAVGVSILGLVGWALLAVTTMSFVYTTIASHLMQSELRDRGYSVVGDIDTRTYTVLDTDGDPRLISFVLHDTPEGQAYFGYRSMTPAEIARRYTNVTVLPGHDSPFGRGHSRWDGLMLDKIFADADCPTVSFTDSSTALAVLFRRKQVRRNARSVKVGDVVFLAHNNFVGLVIGVPSKTTVTALVGWWPGDQGRRHSTVVTLDRDIDVLAFADPRVPVRPRVPESTATVRDKQKIANLLATHPAVDVYPREKFFERAYARWQRYCGLPPEKITGTPDERTLDRLRREQT